MFGTLLPSLGTEVKPQVWLAPVPICKVSKVLREKRVTSLWSDNYKVVSILWTYLWHFGVNYDVSSDGLHLVILYKRITFVKWGYSTRCRTGVYLLRVGTNLTNPHMGKSARPRKALNIDQGSKGWAALFRILTYLSDSLWNGQWDYTIITKYENLIETNTLQSYY